MQKAVVVTASGALALALAACLKSPSPTVTNRLVADDTSDICGVRLVRTEAMDAPEKHAWDLFLMLNQPAKPLKEARGEPDCSKPMGAPNTTSVWETWRLARTEVFLDDGREPPDWNDTSLPNPGFGKTPDDIPSPHNPPATPGTIASVSVKGQITPRFDPEKDQGVFAGRGGIGETHINKVAYKFIKDNCLWSFDGLSRYSKAVMLGKKAPLTFPPDAIEVKAVWVTFTPTDIAAGKQKTYYTATLNNTTYGLVALHVLTKDIPMWFWATFHHRDNPKNVDEVPSTYPQPKALANTVWSNYVLGGTQGDFVTPTGKPTILSDFYVENGFTRSSCITCHANASGVPDPERTADGKLKRTSKGAIAAALLAPQPAAAIGAPDFTAFESDGKLAFPPTDFVWSIPFRAKEEKAPPPARCLI